MNTQRVNLFRNFRQCLSSALAVQIVGEGFHDIRARTGALASRAASVIAVIAVMCVWMCVWMWVWMWVRVKCRSSVTWRFYGVHLAPIAW